MTELREEKQALWSLMEALRRSGEDWLHKKDPKADKSLLSAPFSGMKAKDIEFALRKEDRNVSKGSFPPEKAIILRPPANDPSCVALLWCRWNLAASAREFHSYLGIWRSEVPTRGGERVVRFLGFRFETPQVDGPEHRYFHAQPCRSLGSKDNVLPAAIEVPVKFPTFPIRANGPLDLLLVTALSLRGAAVLREILDTVTSDNILRQTAVTETVKTWRDICDASYPT